MSVSTVESVLFPPESLCVPERVEVKWLTGEWMVFPWQPSLTVWGVKRMIFTAHGITANRQFLFAEAGQDDNNTTKLDENHVIDNGARLLLFVQPAEHAFAPEYCTYLENYRRFARDEIFDRFDLDDCGQYLVLQTPKRFVANWSRYFDQFPRFFAQPETVFNGDSIVYYKEDGHPVSALEQYIHTIIESDRHNFESDFTTILREIDCLSMGMPPGGIAKMRTMLWEMAMRERHDHDYLTEMAMGTYAMLLASLTRVCRDIPFEELESACTILQTHDDVLDRINREDQLEWDGDSFSSVLRYLTREQIGRIRE